MKKIFSIEEENKLGEKIADILMLRPDPDFADRYKTKWGNKTGTGIFRTVIRIVKENKMYYSGYDLDIGSYYHTGKNSTSKKQCINAIIDLMSNEYSEIKDKKHLPDHEREEFLSCVCNVEIHKHKRKI